MKNERSIQTSHRDEVTSVLITLGENQLAGRKAVRTSEVDARSDGVFQLTIPHVRHKFPSRLFYANFIKNDTKFVPPHRAT